MSRQLQSTSECPKGPWCSKKGDCGFDHSMFSCPSGTLCKFRDYEKCLFHHPKPTNKCRNGSKCTRIKTYKCHFYHPNEEIPCFYGEDCTHFKSKKCAFSHEAQSTGIRPIFKRAQKPENALKTPIKKNNIEYVKKDQLALSRRTESTDCSSADSKEEDQKEPDASSECLISLACKELDVAADPIFAFCSRCKHSKTSRYEQNFLKKTPKTSDFFLEFTK